VLGIAVLAVIIAAVALWRARTARDQPSEPLLKDNGASTNTYGAIDEAA